MLTRSRSGYPIAPKIFVAALTALFMAMLAVAYNVQAAVISPSGDATGTWITVSDDHHAAGSSHLLLATYVTNMDRVDLSVPEDTVRKLGEEVCNPAAAWWCLEGIE